MLRKTLVAYALGLSFAAPMVFAEEGDGTTAQRAQNVVDVIERPGVLTPRGKWSFDTSFSYSQNSANRVSVIGYTVLPSLLVGLIEVSDSDRTTMTLGFTGRYGITNATEIEVRVPYVYRNDQISERSLTEGSDEPTNFSLDGGGMGDIEFAMRHQFNFESAPYWVGGLRVKSDSGRSPYEIDVDENNNFTEAPTGSGFWSVEPNISMIYPSDPAVLYANLSYIYNFEDEKRVGDRNDDIQLGDTISIGGGIGFAVNPRLSFSLGLSHRTIFKSQVNGSTAPNAKVLQLDYLNFGVNYKINERTSINVGGQAGLTEDAPDFQLTIRVPFNM